MVMPEWTSELLGEQEQLLEFTGMDHTVARVVPGGKRILMKYFK